MGGRASKTEPEDAALETSTKRALLVGCNYPNTKAQLKGCVNDVENWRQIMTQQYGFEPDNVKILVDQGTEHEAPTGRNIKRELSRLVAESQAGDIVFFHFSGHGMQLPANRSDRYERDGLDEALVPTDMNVIVDDDLRDILHGLDPGGPSRGSSHLGTVTIGVKFTMVADCCHSGGMLDHEQIVISGGAEMNGEIANNATKRNVLDEGLLEETRNLRETKAQKIRSLEFKTMLSMLRGTCCQCKIKLRRRNIRTTLYDLFGQDVSNAVLKNTRDLSEDRAWHIHYVAPGKKPENGLIDPDKGILITGCQSHETAADVEDADGMGFGALSSILTTVLGRHRRKYGDESITNFDLVLKARQMLSKNDFTQNPCLECSEDNAHSNFILW